MNAMIPFPQRNERYPTLREMMPWRRPSTGRKEGWKVFRGPQLGSQAPDDYVVAQSNQPQTTLHELMDHAFEEPEKVLFVILFGGSECEDVCPNMKLIASNLTARYPKQLDAYVITAYYDNELYDKDSMVLGDPNLSAEKKYGAVGPAIYIVDRSKAIIRKSAGLRQDDLNFFLNSQLTGVQSTSMASV